jgi:hypothetical protein
VRYVRELPNSRAYAIDYLHEKVSTASFQDVGITYFYFKHDDREKSNEKVAMILLRNLISKIKVLPPLLLKLFENNEVGNPPKFNDLVDLIISCFQSYTGMFVFFDALDEATEDQRVKMLELIGRLCDNGIRVFLTSQPHLKTRVEELGALVPYEIRAQEMDMDVFIWEELRNKFDKKFPQFPLENKEKIRKSLVEDADGMYILCGTVADLVGSFSSSCGWNYFWAVLRRSWPTLAPYQPPSMTRTGHSLIAPP